MNRKGSAMLRRLGACEDAMVWCKGVKDLQEAWTTCKRSDWMLWSLNKIGSRDDRKLRLYACACVRGTPLAGGRTLWDLLTDERSRTAIDAAAAYAAAYAAARDWQAVLLRQWISREEIERAIAEYAAKEA